MRPISALVLVVWLLVATACTGPPGSVPEADAAPAPAAGAGSPITEPEADPGGEIGLARTGDLVPVGFAPGGIIEGQFADLVAATERLRGHRFAQPPTVYFVSITEAARLRELTAAEAPQRDVEAALYELLGVVDQRDELDAFVARLAAAPPEPVYDYAHRDLIVPLEGQLLSPYEQWVLVHELTHALMQQRFPETVAAYRAATDGVSDSPAALAGLIEGEAVLMQTLFFAELPPAEQQAVVSEAAERSGAVLSDAPAFLRASVRFPYTEGAAFAVDLYGRGGLVALDQAFGRPPWTTEHVLHPERYVALEPAPAVAIAAVRVPGYSVASSGVWGEAGWRALLAGELNGGTVDVAAAGWRSDRYEVRWSPNDAQVAFTARIELDSTRDAVELAAAFLAYVERRMGLNPRLVTATTEDFFAGDYAAVARNGSTVTLVVASNPAAGLLIADQLSLLPPGFATLPAPDEEE